MDHGCDNGGAGELKAETLMLQPVVVLAETFSEHFVQFRTVAEQVRLDLLHHLRLQLAELSVPLVLALTLVPERCSLSTALDRFTDFIVGGC